MLLFGMGVDRERITRAKTQDERIFYVVKWAWSKRRLDELVAAALASAPQSAELAAFAKGPQPDAGITAGGNAVREAVAPAAVLVAL